MKGKQGVAKRVGKRQTIRRERKGTVYMDEKAIRAIETVLEKGDRAEVIPVRHGIVVKRIRRDTVYEPKKQENTPRF